MARISPLDESKTTPLARDILEHHRTVSGKASNMKRTLAHSPTALTALMQWYPLHAEVAGFLGARATTLFASAISDGSDCLICSTFFRRWLIESGENPDDLQLNDRERTLVEYAQQLVRNNNAVPDELHDRLKSFLTDAQLVALTAFAGLMVATNLFNNALAVDLDEYLHSYRKAQS